MKLRKICVKSPPALRRISALLTLQTHPYYFPGREEYDQAEGDPRFDDMFEREDEEAHMLRREAYLIEAACARARKIYVRTGQAPPLGADPAYSEFIATLRPPDADTGTVLSEPGATSESNNGSMSEPRAAATGFLSTVEATDDPALRTPHPAVESLGLKRSLDGYGREIFVESEDTNGKPMVWYQFDPNKVRFRHQRKGFAVIRERVAAQCRSY